MTAKEMIEIIGGRKDMTNNIHAKLDYMYEQTDKMLKAIDGGKDADQCFEYWVTLIDKMDGESETDIKYYNHHVMHLVTLVDEWFKNRHKVVASSDKGK